MRCSQHTTRRVRYIAIGIAMSLSSVGLLGSPALGAHPRDAVPSPDRAGRGGTSEFHVRASWVQPAVSCGARDSAVDMDVSMVQDPLIVAAGSAVDCHAGRAHNSLWLQEPEGDRVETGLLVDAGDRIHASIQVKYQDPPGRLVIDFLLENRTQHTEARNFVLNGEYEFLRGFIEVHRRGPLADFGSVRFSNGLIEQRLGDDTSIQYDMVNASGATQATASAVRHHAFTVVWRHR